MNKKQREMEVLKKIYKEPIVKINHTDKPDFIIDGDNERFGVEITDYYYNDSSARLKNQPGYFNEIIKSDNDSILNKKDRGLITREAIYIKDTTDDKYKFLVDTVGLKYNDRYDYNIEPSYEDVEKQLIDRIQEKNEKSKEYEKLDYYELFIQDREKYFAKNRNRQIRLYNSKLLLNAITKSKFKRVYLFSGDVLSIIGDNPSENMLKYNMIDNASSEGDVSHE